MLEDVENHQERSLVLLLAIKNENCRIITLWGFCPDLSHDWPALADPVLPHQPRLGHKSRPACLCEDKMSELEFQTSILQHQLQFMTFKNNSMMLRLV